MKIVIILVVVLVLVGGGGAGAYFMGMLDSLLGIEDVAGEGKDDNSDAETIDEALYVQMDPISSPVITNGRVEGQVILTISIQVADTAARNDVAKGSPRIRDAILQSLYAHPLVRHSADGTIDIRRTKARLKDLLVELLGPQRVLDVLIVKALQTR
jgi:flagellar FliL protein